MSRSASRLPSFAWATNIRNLFLDLAYREDLDVPEVNSTMRLVARAVQGFEEKECRALDALDFAIRHSAKGGR